MKAQLSAELSVQLCKFSRISTLRGRASLTNALRQLTHFSNYAATTVAELKGEKGTFPDKLRRQTCQSELGLEVARVRVVSEGNEG